MKTKLLLFAFLTTIFAGAQAVGDPVTDGNNTYTITALGTPNEVELTSSTDTNIIVPATISGSLYTVTAIGADAFEANTGITSIQLPITVTLIKEDAFRGTTGLTTVTFPNGSGITNIETAAFRSTAINDINTILSNVVVLGPSAFIVNNSFTSITTTSTLTTLGGSQIFRANDKLVTADLSASTSLTEIATATFRLDPLLETVSLPSSITSIANNAFIGSNAIKTFQIAATTPPTVAGDGTSFGDVTNIDLIVPAAGLAAYLADPFWSTFKSVTLSTDNLKQELNWSFYPNPTNDVVSIKNSKGENANVSVYDLSGRALLAQSINNGQTEINISNLPSGLYIFNVTSENGRFSRRVVKQ